MATNNKGDYLVVWHKSVICSDPATPASGDPVRIGYETGVALTAESTAGTDLSGNATGYTSVDVGPARWRLSCKGVNDSGNSAIADGDLIFYVDADTPKLSKKASGYFFGFARGAVNSGATASIDIDHVPSPGNGTIAAGAINTTQLAANAVTAAKLTTTLATGFIPLALTNARLIAANDIAAKNAADGGLISLDTDPTLKRINGATDKQLRIAWAATSVIPITWSFPYPPDLDDTATVVVNLLMAMAGATDTPLVGVAYFEGVGDTNAGGNTTALSNTVTKKTVTIAASDIGPYPIGASVEIVPAAHGTDAMYLYGAWIEYTRK